MITFFRHLAFVLSMVSLPGLCVAEEPIISEVSWTELAAKNQLLNGTILKESSGTILRVENQKGVPYSAHLLTLEAPKITASSYTISGQIRYESVEGDGYLEMWSHFGSSSYFSRTLGTEGPMAKLTGSSDWRQFALPFNAHPLKSPPNKLVFNIQFPGKGIVFLKDVRLSQSSLSQLSSDQAQAWWSDKATGVLGGIAGALIGCLGSLMEWLAAKGKGRTFVLTMTRLFIAVGAFATIGGIAALLLRQPYSVWFGLLLIGVLLVGIFPFRLRRYAGRFQDLEMRRIHSMDAAV